MTTPRRAIAHVLHVADSHHPWRANRIERLTVLGFTASGVRVAPGTLPGVTVRPGHTVLNRPDHLVSCLVDEDAWRSAQCAIAHWQAALDAFAQALRDLGRYDVRLQHAGSSAPNPLTPTVFHLYQPPDRTYGPNYVTTGDVPTIQRMQVDYHTPKMLKAVGDYPAAQTYCYLCPDDAAAERITTRRAQAVAARDAWRTLIRQFGTYAEARLR